VKEKWCRRKPLDKDHIVLPPDPLLVSDRELDRKERSAEADREREARVQAAAQDRAHGIAKDMRLKLLEAATKDAQEAMKVLLAINGGGVAGVLAFVGSIAGKPDIENVLLIRVARSVYWFGGGVLGATTIAICAYLSNLFFAESNRIELGTDEQQRWSRWGNRTRVIGFVAALISVAVFVMGAYVATKGIFFVLKYKK